MAGKLHSFHSAEIAPLSSLTFSLCHDLRLLPIHDEESPTSLSASVLRLHMGTSIDSHFQCMYKSRPPLVGSLASKSLPMFT